MQGTVIRNGRHQGEIYVEVSHAPDGVHASPINYAVPVTEELPVGTLVDIVVTVVDVPLNQASVLPGADVSISSPFATPSNTFNPPFAPPFVEAPSSQASTDLKAALANMEETI